MSSSPHDEPLRIVALYAFCRLDDAPAWRDRLSALCRAQGLRGTLLLAPEGINGTVAGRAEAVDQLLAALRSDDRFQRLETKFATAATQPFHRMKVRMKREIVTMGVGGLDPQRSAGTYVEPAAWNALIADPETVVIDTRNAYEVGLGTFAGAVDPGTSSFRDFPAWLDERRDALAGRKVAMFCTGGIRCEKATAYARAIGIDSVFHLKGGILRYLEEVAPQDSLWAGECFVFDERVSVGHGLEPGLTGLCRACRMPVTEADRQSPHYREGISCARCHVERSAEDRARYAERQRQVERARQRGEPLPIGR